MLETPLLPVAIRNFDKSRYLESNPLARHALTSGDAVSALDHYLRFGIDENRLYHSPRNRSCGVLGRTVFGIGVRILPDLRLARRRRLRDSRMKLISGEFTIELPRTHVLGMPERMSSNK